MHGTAFHHANTTASALTGQMGTIHRDLVSSINPISLGNKYTLLTLGHSNAATSDAAVTSQLLSVLDGL